MLFYLSSQKINKSIMQIITEMLFLILYVHSFILYIINIRNILLNYLLYY